MAEAKNNFLKAKMNQDLDDRLLPNGEYRTAQNVLVGKSEEDSVGTLSNIKGNVIVSGTQLGLGIYGQIEIIGYYMDPTNDRIITFTTDWTQTGSAPDDADCAIRSYNINNGTYTTLVEGYFLNFSTQSTVTDVSLLEDLLFWTDNRNQPRKINVATALREGTSHYYKENHISVSKYNPYKAISLLKQEKEPVITVNSATSIEVAENTGIVVGMTVLGNRGSTETILPSEYITVTNVEVSSIAGQTTVTLSSAPIDPIQVGDNLCFLISTMTDQAGDPTWPGDPDYLEDKFVRFAYRFKFEDNEYSIFSPFTQIAFIPKQKGYFINGQENNAFSSTIVNWFENNVNNIELVIPLPDKGINISSTYKISSIDILYKESDAVAVKVLDTVEVSSINNDESFYVYSYQSRKPIRTLPTEQTVRVFDKVPVTAKTQEVISNRIVYGNFLTKPTPPKTISYTVNFQPKIASCDFPSFIEYPNHNIKQNRNYQVGWVLSDKFGRQSSVILSPVSEITIGTGNFGGSTIYAEYIADDPVGSGIVDPSFMPGGVIDWFGNSLVVQVNDPIAGGTTGLYATPSGSGSGFALDGSVPAVISGTTYTFTLDVSQTNHETVPQINEYLRGEYVDYVKVTNVDSTNAPVYIVTTEEEINSLYLSNPPVGAGLFDVKYSYDINPNGWYSYKIVVKQIEQDYYNVYLPSAFGASGLVVGSTDTDLDVSYLTLINDNINKIPRDLAEVGPDQKQYRSSVKLYGRVAPETLIIAPGDNDYTNKQYYPARSSDTSTVVGNANDLIGATTTEEQYSAEVTTTVNSDTIRVKLLSPGAIPRGARVSTTTVQGITPSTYVTNCVLLGYNFDNAPGEDGLWADITLSNVVQAADGNNISFVTEPGAYIFQGETDPILARISTESQFGVNYKTFELTNASAPESRFQLAVYETDPFVSAIDIYWESSQEGLISDVNEDILSGYDGPAALEPTGFTLFEDDIIGTNVTQTFYPLDQNGVQIPQTTLESFSVTDGEGNVTQNGDLFSITQITGGVDQGAYQITTSALFAYLWNSENKDVYTFNIEVRNTNPSTDWEVQTLFFTGALQNRPPNFTLPSPPWYVFQDNVGQGTPIADFGVFFNPANPTNPVNGTIDTPQIREDLIWDIVSGNDDGYFEMDPRGFITLTAAGVNMPFGSYPVEIRLRDAVDLFPNNNFLVDSGSLSLIQEVLLIKGYAPTNFDDPVNGFETNFQCGSWNATAPYTAESIKYMSDFNYLDLDPNLVFDFLPATLDPNFGVNFIPSTPALRTGEFVFGLESWYILPYDCPPGIGEHQASANIRVEAYKRPIGQDGIPLNGGAAAPWTPAPDLNGIVVQDTNQNPSGNVLINIYNKQNEPVTINGNGQNAWLGYGDTMHEYAFWIKYRISSGFPKSTMYGNEYFRDLHYPGPDFSQIVYQFTNLSYTGQGPGEFFYADTPFFQYNERYFTTSDLVYTYEVNPPNSSGNSLVAYVKGRYDQPTGNLLPLMDAQLNWFDFTGGGVMSSPEIYYCYGVADYDINNKVIKTGTPPYVQTKKGIQNNNTYPPTTANFQVRGPSYPGEFPWNRSSVRNVNPQVPPGSATPSWNRFFP